MAEWVTLSFWHWRGPGFKSLSWRNPERGVSC